MGTIFSRRKGDAFCIAILGSDLEATCTIANTLLKQSLCNPALSDQGMFIKQVETNKAGIKWTMLVTVRPGVLNGITSTQLKTFVTANPNMITLQVKTDNTTNTDSELEEWMNTELSSTTRLEFIYKPEEFQRNKKGIREILLERLRIAAELDCGSVPASSSSQGNRNMEAASSMPTEERRAPTTTQHEKKQVTDTERRLYRDTLRRGKAPSNFVPVIVVGHEEAGKTTLIKRLLNLDDAKHELSCTTTCVVNKDNNTLTYEKKDCIDELNKQRMYMAMKAIEEEQARYADDDQSKGTAKIQEECIDEIVGSENNGEINVIEYPNSKKATDAYLCDVINVTQSKEPKIYITFREYSGCDTFILSNPAFLPPKAVYLIVVDISLELERKLSAIRNEKNIPTKGILKEYTVLETVKFWASSIRERMNVHDQHVTLVAVQKENIVSPEGDDKVNKNIKAIQEELFKNDLDIEVVLLDSRHHHEPKLKSLRKKIIKSSLRYSKQVIPAQWVEVEHELILLKEKKAVTTFDEINSVAKRSDIPLTGEDELINCLQFQQHSGNIIFIQNVHETNPVLLNTNILPACMYALEKLGRNKRLTNGMVCKSAIDRAHEVVQDEWNISYDTDIMFHLLQYFNVILPLSESTKEDEYLIPCCLGVQTVDRKEVDIKEEASTIQVLFQEFHASPTCYDKFLLALPNLLNGPKSPKLSYLHSHIFIDGENVYLEINWISPAIYIRLKNISQRKKLKMVGCPSILEQIKVAVENSFQDSCHINVKCDKHDSFVNLKTLEEDEEARCESSTHVHAVQKFVVLGVYDSEQRRRVSERSDDERPEAKDGNSAKPNDERQKDKIPKDEGPNGEIPKDEKPTDNKQKDEMNEGENNERTWNEISNDKRQKDGGRQKNTETIYDSRPTQKALGRLAKYLEKEQHLSLARLLGLENALAVTSRIKKDFKTEPAEGRMELLWNWWNYNPTKSLHDLVNIMSNDYPKESLFEVINRQYAHTFELDSRREQLDVTPTEAHVDKIFEFISVEECAFIFLELGLKWVYVKQARESCKDDFHKLVLHLFTTWKRTCRDTATLRLLLNTVGPFVCDKDKFLRELDFV